MRTIWMLNINYNAVYNIIKTIFKLFYFCLKKCVFITFSTIMYFVTFTVIPLPNAECVISEQNWLFSHFLTFSFLTFMSITSVLLDVAPLGFLDFRVTSKYSWYIHTT